MRISLISLILLFLASFNLVWAQSQTESRILAHFDQIAVSGNIRVELRQGTEASVKLETEEVEAKKVLTEVEGQQLRVKLKPGIYPDAKVNMLITYPELRELRASTGAKIFVLDEVNGDKLEVYAGSGGQVDIEVGVSVLEQRVMEGSRIHIKGLANNQVARVYSGGILDAKDLASKYTFARVNTGGVATIQVQNELEASVGTGGRLTYYGEPAKESVKTSLGAKVNRVE